VATIAALLETPGALAALRRTLPRSSAALASCRTAGALGRLLETRLVDAVILSPRRAGIPAMARLLAQFPSLPRVLLAPFRPDDGELLMACQRGGVAAVAVEGVDDAMLGDLVLRVSLSAARRRALAEAPRVLRLSEQLQQKAWNYLLDKVGEPVRTSAMALRFRVSREHLSRQFGAGGAPNLKRVIDLTRVVSAAQLLGNPGYSVETVAHVLGFASSSHLSETARRVAGVSARQLPELGPRGVLGAFVKGKTRSRLV
jgi:AraC-like DNA-binding protein